MSEQNDPEDDIDDEREDDEDCGSCDACGCNLTSDDINGLCDQCEWWRDAA